MSEKCFQCYSLLCCSNHISKINQLRNSVRLFYNIAIIMSFRIPFSILLILFWDSLLPITYVFSFVALTSIHTFFFFVSVSSHYFTCIRVYAYSYVYACVHVYIEFLFHTPIRYNKQNNKRNTNNPNTVAKSSS